MKINTFVPQFYHEHLSNQFKRTELLILLILIGLIQKFRWVRLEELATQFPQRILFESRRKKIQRFLSLKHLNIENIWWPIFSYWLARTFKQNDVLELAIDRTQWKNVNILMISLIYKRRAIPIYFQVLSKKGQTNLAEQQLILAKVLELLKDYKKVILGLTRILLSRFGRVAFKSFRYLFLFKIKKK